MAQTIADELREAYEVKFDIKQEVYGKDLCDLLAPMITDGGAEGNSETFVVVATEVPVFIEALSAGQAQTSLGGKIYVSSNKLTMKRRPVTSAITPKYKIRVYARDGKAERVFEEPIEPDRTFQPMVELKASLVTQGYRQ